MGSIDAKIFLLGGYLYSIPDFFKSLFLSNERRAENFAAGQKFYLVIKKR